MRVFSYWLEARAIKKSSFGFFNPPLTLFLKNFFFCKKRSLHGIRLTKKLCLGFRVKKLIYSLSLLFLLIPIGLNFNFTIKWLNNKANHENVQFSTIRHLKLKIKSFKNNSISCFRTLYIKQKVFFSQTVSVTKNMPKSVRQWPGRPGFNPRSSHTKDFKNGTWYHLA